MSERRYRPINLGQAIDNQGRLRNWVAKQAGISPALLSLSIAGERTLRESAAQSIARVLQMPFFMLFESADADKNTADMEKAA
jgi:hypothetical protein